MLFVSAQVDVCNLAIVLGQFLLESVHLVRDEGEPILELLLHEFDVGFHHACEEGCVHDRLRLLGGDGLLLHVLREPAGWRLAWS